MWTFNHHSTICGKDYFLPIELPWHFVKDQLTMNVRIYVWTPNCFILIYVSFLLPVPLYFDYCIIIVSFEMENISLPTLLLFFKMVLAIFSPLHFNINFKNSLSISAKKKDSWDFDRDSVQSVAQLEKSCHLNNIKSSNKRRQMSFLLLRSSFLSAMFCAL